MATTGDPWGSDNDNNENPWQNRGGANADMDDLLKKRDRKSVGRERVC